MDDSVERAGEGNKTYNPTSSSILVSPTTESYHFGSAASDGSESELSFSVGGAHPDMSKEGMKKRWKKLVINRIPKGKAAFVVFLINVLESFVFYSTSKIVYKFIFESNKSEQTLNVSFPSLISSGLIVYTILQFTAGRLLYPLAGLVADTYLGRGRVIKIGLWLFWLGTALLLLTISLQLRKDSVTSWFLVPSVLIAVVFMLASACVEATIIPFGVDQIQQGASSDELSSYFSWYYFGRQLGNILNGVVTIITAILYYSAKKSYSDDEHDEAEVVDGNMLLCIEAITALVVVTMSIIIHFSAENWYFNAKQEDNPLKSILGVLSYAATVKRQTPRYRRSFRYGEGRLPRIELAKIEYDGKYDAELVENVKTFVRVFFLICCLGFTFLVYGGMFNALTTLMSLSEYSSFLMPRYKQMIKIDFFLIADNIVVMISILVFNHIILPYNPGFTMKRRMGTGALFIVISVAIVTGLVKTFFTMSHPFLWLIFPISLFSIGEMLIFVSGLEFIYAQAPDSMKGLLTGMFYFIFGLFNCAGTLVFWKLGYDEFQIYLYVMLAISFLGFIIYTLGALFYKNRQRPTNDDSEQDLMNRSIATNVYWS